MAIFFRNGNVIVRYGGVPAFTVEKSKSVAKTHFQSLKKVHKAGVPIDMGTDSGTPFNLHGENLK